MVLPYILQFILQYEVLAITGLGYRMASRLAIYLTLSSLASAALCIARVCVCHAIVFIMDALLVSVSYEIFFAALAFCFSFLNQYYYSSFRWSSDYCIVHVHIPLIFLSSRPPTSSATNRVFHLGIVEARLVNKVKNTNTHTHTEIPPWEDQCEWHRMTRMTGPDCAVMCNLINTHTHTHTQFAL